MPDDHDQQHPGDHPPSFSYFIDEEFVRIVARGTPTSEEFDELLQQIAADLRYRRGMPILHDRRAATTPTTEYAHRVSDVVRAHAHQLGPCRWAVIVGNHDRGLAYGMSRMISSLHDSSTVTSCPFLTVEEALTWLRGGGAQ